VEPEIHVLGLTIKTFGLALGLTFVCCGLMAARRLKELGKPIDWAYETIFAALVGGVVGARVWWVIQNPDQLKGNVIGGLFGGSGLVFYGGLIGGAIAVLLWGRRRRYPTLALLDLAAPAIALGYAAGRIGCQVSGDGDYGKPWDGPWAMAYPHGTVPTDVPVHPTPIYETLTMGIVTLVLWRLRDRFAPGRLFALYLVLGGIERFLVEFIRRNPPDVLGLTLAQVISLGMLAAGAAWLALTRSVPVTPAPAR
jgi:phosphatidylglycerol:prolipoprotein diacylglycerol transferase